jgi:LPPG:FO 2-phospho-L-lactate transferase
MRIVMLAGGVGGSKLALGFYHIMNPRDLTAIANTGDDIVMHGLHVSPDPDILIYTLADAVNPATGWGFRDESFRVAQGLARYGRPVWFQLGDRDLATHIHRTAMLKDGATLSQVINSICAAHGVTACILPMSDSFIPTMLQTGEGRMHLQEYFVRRRCEPKLLGIEFEGAGQSVASPGVVESIRDADVIIIAPSNPLISIGPILAVPGIRDALHARRAHVIAVSPLVDGKSLKGPTDKMLAELGHDVSTAGVARLYCDICSVFVIDEADADEAGVIADMGMRALVMPTVMRTLEDKQCLARAILHAAGTRP